MFCLFLFVVKFDAVFSLVGQSPFSGFFWAFNFYPPQHVFFFFSFFPHFVFFTCYVEMKTLYDDILIY